MRQCVCWLLLSLLVLAVVATQEEEERKPSIWKLITSPALIYWEAVKKAYSGLTFLSPSKPNTDFRGGLGEDKEEIGRKEKVKGAVEKSMEKTKDAIEESAKSAAKMATGTADKLLNFGHPVDEL